MSITLLSLDERLCRMIGDWIQVDVTTNLTSNTSVISTSLNNYDHGQDDFFVNYWVYIEELANAGVERLIYDYLTATGTCSIRGANLTTGDASAATVRITRSRFDDRKTAINDSLRELKHYLFKDIDDSMIISGNPLVNAHFEDWTTSSYPDYYSVTNATAAATTTAGLHRGGTKSAKVAATAADGYMEITSNALPILLDLAGKTLNFRCWAYPEVVDDAFLTIYTTSPDGDTQTLNSTTSVYAGKWNLIELENQTINSDINYISFRFRVHTNAKYAYFDDARVEWGEGNYYVLPADLQIGTLQRVEIQKSGDLDSIKFECEPKFGWDIVDDQSISGWAGTKLLYLKNPYPIGHRLRLIGYAPFLILQLSSSTVNLNDDEANLLLEYAAYLLYTRMAGPLSADDANKCYQKAQEHYNKFSNLLPYLRKKRPVGQFKVDPL